ncbi:MAG: aromatic amino acid ammonia-lyase [Acidobacteriota bacterium]|nr:aromatic amino acid ammonia-lyase [Acidobacteriota bacterium]
MTQPTLQIGGDTHLSLPRFYSIVKGETGLELASGLGDTLAPAAAMVEDRLAKRQLIYGLTTGFGPLGDKFLPTEARERVQRNLIYHLAAGVGPPLEPYQARAVLLARLLCLSKGRSAVSLSTLALMQQWLVRGLVPHIPSLGTVGASGDLTPLAHLALALMGEGKVRYEGAWRVAGPILDQLGIARLRPGGREGLALVNGTSAMTALSALNGVLARRALMLALDLGLFYAEVLQGDRDAYHPGLAEVRPHPGQIFVSDYLYRRSETSRRLRHVSTRPRFEAPESGISGDHEPMQEPYSTRCLPQIYGAVMDVLDFHDRTVETELNGVSDNPVFMAEEDIILHGGNFYGQHISFASDALANALVKCAAHLERKINRLCHPKLNRHYPAFLQAGDLGINSGFMGAQVTATALVAEMRGMSNPLSTATIATNADNQDVVSMGTLAALRCHKLLPHLYRLLAIDAMTIAQAYDLCTADEQKAFTQPSRELWQIIRTHTSKLEEDRPLSQEIESLAETWLHV